MMLEQREANMKLYTRALKMVKYIVQLYAVVKDAKIGLHCVHT